MALVLLTVVAATIIYNEHKDSKMHKAELAGTSPLPKPTKFRRFRKQKTSTRDLPAIIVTPDASPVYVAGDDWAPPAYEKDAPASPPSGSVPSTVSLEHYEGEEQNLIPAKNPARFALE